MAKTWAEWETLQKEGADVSSLLNLDPPKEDLKDFPSSLGVMFEGKEFYLCLSRLPPVSLAKDKCDVIVTKPSIPFTELFHPLLLDPSPADKNQCETK
ncbi:Hypothetical predicted protein [Octopus vulgaris]|uniref:Uncharacterized protein n=1 Tax=Octopus vulgaris TaxID=6645 RepID=A0AA36BAA3_OCTVU|nr:Hypothetical predicted protein [Octopus vulgaris]